MLAPQGLTQAEPAPKQCKLLGATLKGVGLITTVSVANVWRWALVEDANGKETHVFLADLGRDNVTLPAGPQPYRQVNRRIGYGLFEEAYELEPVEFSDLTERVA